MTQRKDDPPRPNAPRTRLDLAVELAAYLLTARPKPVPPGPGGSDATSAGPGADPATASSPGEDPHLDQTSTSTSAEAPPGPGAPSNPPARPSDSLEPVLAIAPPRAANASRSEASTLPQTVSDRTRTALDPAPETVPTLDPAAKRIEGAASTSGETSSLPPAAAEPELAPDSAGSPHSPLKGDRASARSSGSPTPASHSLGNPKDQARPRRGAVPATAPPIAGPADHAPGLERNGEPARADAAPPARSGASHARDDALPGAPASRARRDDEVETSDAQLTGEPTDLSDEPRRSSAAEAELLPSATIAERGMLPGPPTRLAPTPTLQRQVEPNAAAEPVSGEPKPSTTGRTHTSEAPQPQADGTVSSVFMAEPGSPSSRPPQAELPATPELISTGDTAAEPRDDLPERQQELLGDRPASRLPASDAADSSGGEDGPARKQTTEPEGPAEVPSVEPERRTERDGVTAGGQDRSDPVARDVREPQSASAPDARGPTDRADAGGREVAPDPYPSTEPGAGDPAKPESSMALDAPQAEDKSIQPTAPEADALAEMPSDDPEPRSEDDEVTVDDPIGSDEVEKKGGPPQHAPEPASAKGLAPAGETGLTTVPDQRQSIETAVQDDVSSETAIVADATPPADGPAERAAAAEGPVDASPTEWGPPTNPDEEAGAGDDRSEPHASARRMVPETVPDRRRRGGTAAQDAAAPDSVVVASTPAAEKEPLRLRPANADSLVAAPPAEPRGSAASSDATAGEGSPEPAREPRGGQRSDVAKESIPIDARQGVVIPDPHPPTEAVSKNAVPPAGVTASAPSGESRGATDPKRTASSGGDRPKPPTGPRPERQPTSDPGTFDLPAPADRVSREAARARRRSTGTAIREVVSAESRPSAEAASAKDGSGRAQAADADGSAAIFPDTPDAEVDRDRATTGEGDSTETIAEANRTSQPASECIIVDEGGTRGAVVTKAVPHRRQRIEPPVAHALDVRTPDPGTDAPPAPDALPPGKRDTGEGRSQGNPRGASRAGKKVGAGVPVARGSKAKEVAPSALTADAAEPVAPTADALLPAPTKTVSPSQLEAEREPERLEQGEAVAEADGVSIPADPPPGPKSDAGSPTIEEARPSAAPAADAAAEGVDSVLTASILDDMDLKPEAAGTEPVPSAPALRRSPSRWDAPVEATASTEEKEVAEPGESALSTALRGIAVVVVAGGALTAGLLALRPDAPEPAITVRAPRVIETQSVPLETGPAPRPLRVDLAKTLRDLDLDEGRPRFVRWVPEAPAAVCESLKAAGWSSQDWSESPLGDMSECLAERTFGDGKGASGFAVLRGRDTLSEIRIKLNLEDTGPRRAAARETGALVAGLFDRWRWDGGAALSDRIAALEPFQDDMHGTTVRLMREHGDVERWNLVLRFPTPPAPYKASPEERVLAAAGTGGTFKPSGRR